MDDTYFSQDPYIFDQTEKGWRRIDKQGEYIKAANTIEEYLKRNLGVICSQDKVSIQTIHFHAGQEYAVAGKEYYQQAIGHFKQALKGKDEWDLYVKGSIAFLQKDRKTLNACAAELNNAAKKDLQHRANAQLLDDFITGLGINSKTYAQIYG